MKSDPRCTGGVSGGRGPKGDDMTSQERWAEAKAALASGDWARFAAWYESERQLILAFVEAARQTRGGV